MGRSPYPGRRGVNDSRNHVEAAVRQASSNRPYPPLMTEHVLPYELGVEWEPNAPEASFTVTDRGAARLSLNVHPDDDDPSLVVLAWSGVQATRFGPYNDEGLRHHKLYDAGLSGLLWSGEVEDSLWLAEVSNAVAVPAAHHFVVVTKEALVEVLADRMTAERRRQ